MPTVTWHLYNLISRLANNCIHTTKWHDKCIVLSDSVHSDTQAFFPIHKRLSVLGKYIVHVECLLLCEKSFVIILVTAVCLSVCLFACLSVCSRCTGHTTGPFVLIFFTADVFCLVQGPSNFFLNRIKVKVNVTTWKSHNWP